MGKFPLHRRLAARKSGFALVVTITVMVLLALLSVGLLSLSSISLLASSRGLAQAEARTNARLALTIALSELQQAMGPDRRISARAATLAQHPQLGATIPDNSPRSWWVGASTSDPDEGLDATRAIGPDNPGVKWLISGLKADLGPAQQVSSPSPFENPVAMYDDQSIDTATLTGGQPIEAGIVTIPNVGGARSGGYAYFIDDEGMKAQLVAKDPELTNQAPIPSGGGLLPASYDLGILQGMEDFEGIPVEEYQKLLSLNDLPLIAGDINIVREKRLGYTTFSRGVLSDVRKGGLKRDLTIAFERDQVFETVFPKGRGGSFTSSYVVMDKEKFEDSKDLRENGYIHWEMFKDYYNIKKHIQTTGGRSGGEFLDSSLFTKEDLCNGYNNSAFGRGQLGPHAIGNNSNVPARHRQLPYGEMDFIDPPSNTQQYVHNPITPILARMHQNAWVDLLPPAVRGGRQRIKTNVQLWKSQYNPFNINLRVIGDQVSPGPRIIHTPRSTSLSARDAHRSPIAIATGPPGRLRMSRASRASARPAYPMP